MGDTVSQNVGVISYIPRIHIALVRIEGLYPPMNWKGYERYEGSLFSLRYGHDI